MLGEQSLSSVKVDGSGTITRQTAMMCYTADAVDFDDLTILLRYSWIPEFSPIE
jgi:hypothetical protein